MVAAGLAVAVVKDRDTLLMKGCGFDESFGLRN
jgi:hypothetical protein